MDSAPAHFSSLLSSLAAAPEENISLSFVTRELGERSAGALLLFLALPMVLPIPAPGISVIFGVPLVLVSIQLVLGVRTLWLPQRLARRGINRDELDIYVKRALPVLRKMELLVRPRLAGLTQGVALRAVGAMCLVLALIIALPVPLGHLVPGAAISVMALSLIERDGVMMLIGLLIGALAFVVVAFAMIGLAALGRSIL